MNKIDRVIGSFPTFYKQAVLTHLVQEMTSDGSSITFYNFNQGQVGFQLKESHLHKDAVWLYKWLRAPAGGRYCPEAIDFLKPWLKEFAAVNEDVPMDKFGFPKDLYLPGNDLIVQKYMRGNDRLEIFEPRDEMYDLLNIAMGDDPRVHLHKQGADTEAYFKSIMPARTARALVYIDLNQNTSYIQQLRARNALHAILKRFPTATFLVTWDQKEEQMPWMAMEAFAQTGYKHCYASVQFAEKDYAERKLFESLKLRNQVHNEVSEQMHKDGEAHPVFQPIKTLDDTAWYPQSLAAFKPSTNWEGAGAAVLNAGPGYGGALQAIGEGLRGVLNKPEGAVYGRWAPLYEPHVYETGGGWYDRMSYRNPGISLPQDYQIINTDQIVASINRQFVGHLMNRLDYIPYEGAPKAINDIAAEPYKLSEQGRRMIETVPRRVSRREKKKASSASVMDAVQVYVEAMKAIKSFPEMLNDYKVTHQDFRITDRRIGRSNFNQDAIDYNDELDRASDDTKIDQTRLQAYEDHVMDNIPLAEAEKRLNLQGMIDKANAQNTPDEEKAGL